MRQTVLRFSHSGGNTDFYWDEALRIQIQRTQRIDVFSKRKNKVGVYQKGHLFKRFIITFQIKYEQVETINGTVEKLETLYNLIDTYKQPEVITIYYRYLEDTSIHTTVQMKRDDMKWIYSKGTKKITTFDIVFQEALKESTITTVITPPIGRSGGGATELVSIIGT